LESDHKVTIHSSLLGLGGVATSRGQPARAARLWGAVEALEDNFGIRMTPAGLSLAGYETHLAAARFRLDEEEFAAAWSEGKTMPLEEAIRYAVSEEEPAPTPEVPTSGTQPTPLTRREKEVADLVAQGLTNRNIAERLHISESTVEKHVANTLRKLNLRSRAQIATWATEQGLFAPSTD
jgi:DNA-binding CsgD family transcriptional regulator